MPTTRYSKYEATLDDLDMADLMKMLQDRLMESGYQRNPWDPDPNYQQSMQDLYDAIAEALINNELVNDQMIEGAMDAENWMDSELGETVKELAQRLEREGYLKPQEGDGEERVQGVLLLQQGELPQRGGRDPQRRGGQAAEEAGAAAHENEEKGSRAGARERREDIQAVSRIAPRE